jgi:hypothetical protein
MSIIMFCHGIELMFRFWAKSLKNTAPFSFSAFISIWRNLAFTLIWCYVAEDPRLMYGMVMFARAGVFPSGNAIFNE